MAGQIEVARREGKGLVGRALFHLAALVYPPRCIACPSETDAPGALCAECWRQIEFISGPVCAQCGTPVEAGAPGQRLSCDSCALDPPPWRDGRAALIYGGAGRRVILQLKHGDRLDIAPTLASWLARAAPDLIDRADIVAPVPLHWSRLFRRRYNQSAELIRALVPPQKRGQDLLRRVKSTPLLDGKRRDERSSLLAEAIALGPHDVAGKSILLVDDVLTTGATLRACARILLTADAKEVNVLTLARVVRDKGA